jgi:hypothetical protein
MKIHTPPDSFVGCCTFDTVDYYYYNNDFVRKICIMSILSLNKKRFIFLFLFCSIISSIQTMSFKDYAILALPTVSLCIMNGINSFQPQLVPCLQTMNFVTHAPHPGIQIGTALFSMCISTLCLKKKIYNFSVKNPEFSQKDVSYILFIIACLETVMATALSIDTLSYQKKLTADNMFYATGYNLLNVVLPMLYVYCRPVKPALNELF